LICYRLLDIFLEMYARHDLGPINTISIYDTTDIQLAFRQFQQGSHIGKIVVRFPEDPFTIPHVQSSPSTKFRPDASYLLLGGFGGLGRAVATWMVHHGARHLVIISRTAGQRPQHKKFMSQLEAQGCTIQVFAGRVEDAVFLRKAIAEFKTQIRGIIHLVMDLHVRFFWTTSE
jgi:hypothetical protein